MMGKLLKITKKHNWIQGVYESPKSLKLHNFKSSWELTLYRFLDSSPLVEKWESECVKIPYFFNRKRRNYIPDVLINDQLLLEVKPMNQIRTQMNLAKFEAASNFCMMKRWTFRVITKERLTATHLSEEIISCKTKKL